jgi:hypothetical protein
MQALILIAGGTGTFLAAIQLDVCVALATAVVTALTTKLQADQAETSLVQYNQALASLKNIEAWWKALSPWEEGPTQEYRFACRSNRKSIRNRDGRLGATNAVSA